MGINRFPDIAKGYPFPELEMEVLAEWRDKNIFELSLKKTENGDPFVFFEGPPTANNRPHVGHVVTRVIKDLFPRFQTMRGRHVVRKAGWDTHGLPVEIEVEKRLGFSGKQDIEAYGVEKFNQACLESVQTYQRQWSEMTERIGFWLDLDSAYYTYLNTYIESIWWALKRLWEQELLLEDYKSSPTALAAAPHCRAMRWLRTTRTPTILRSGCCLPFVPGRSCARSMARSGPLPTG